MKKQILVWASLLLLNACQGLPGNSSAAIKLNSDAKKAPTSENAATTLQAQIQTGPNLRFEIRFPSQAGFKTQALDCTQFAKAKVLVRGVGMTGPLYPAAANAGNQYLVPITGCSLNLTVPNVPSGENRVAEIRAYTAAGGEIQGAFLSATFDITANPTTVQMSYRSTPAGQVIASLLDQNKLLLAAELNTTQLQTLLDQIMGATGTYPNFSYTTHPMLINTAALVQDIIAQAGNLATIDPTKANYKLQPARVFGDIQGLLGNDTYTVKLSDPFSTPITKNNGVYDFNKLPPGSWSYQLNYPAQYSSDPNTITANIIVGFITVTAGQEVNLNTLTLYPKKPTITSLSVNSGSPGSSVLINGTNFQGFTGLNTVKFGNVTVPTSDLKVISLNQLEVKVPNGISGATTVSLTIGTQTAAQTPAFTVLPPMPQGLSASNISSTGFDLSWNAVAGATAYKIYKNGVLNSTVTAPTLTGPVTGLSAASAYNMTVTAVVGGVESSPTPILIVNTASQWTSWTQLGPNNENVLSLAAPKTNPNLVFFGSADDGNPSAGPIGGIWKCNVGTCNNLKLGSETGSVQALAINPQNAQILYAGTLSKGIFRSSDGGSTWAQVNTGINANHMNIRSLIVDPAHDNHIYAGVANSNDAQVYFSSDGGNNWSLASTNLPTSSLSSISSLAIYNPPSPAEALIYAGTAGGGVFKTTGGSLANINWQPINNGLPTFGGLVFLAIVDVRALATHPVLSERLFGSGTGGCFIPFVCSTVPPIPGGAVGGYLPGVWRRIEGDANGWRQVGHNGTNAYTPATLTATSTGLTQMVVQALSIDPVTPDKMYAASDDGIFRSLDGGLSWNAYNTGLANSLLQINAIVTQPQALWIGTEAGLYKAQ
jgi:hypothetical protein